MSEIRLLAVPYEVGALRVGVGRGPERLIEAGAERALERHGASVSLEIIELNEDLRDRSGASEAGAAFELIGLLAAAVHKAMDDGAFPVILSGSCLASLGVVTGLQERTPGVVWFDAHGDFNTPESTVDGYFDGMPLATLTGAAWRTMVSERRVRTVRNPLSCSPGHETSTPLSGFVSIRPPSVCCHRPTLTQMTRSHEPSSGWSRHPPGCTCTSTWTSSTPRRRASTSTECPAASVPPSSPLRSARCSTPTRFARRRSRPMTPSATRKKGCRRSHSACSSVWPSGSREPDEGSGAARQPGGGRRRGERVARIGPGLLVLLGISREDGEAEADRLAEKVRALRIFDDADGRMNEPLGDREILCVSQFTLYGDTRKGTRPSYIEAAPGGAGRTALRPLLREGRGEEGGLRRLHGGRSRQRRAGHGDARGLSPKPADATGSDRFGAVIRLPRLPRRLLAGGLIFAVSLLPAAAASAAKHKPAKPKIATRMFNDRYCEVLAVHGTFPNLLADVWNTYGLNNCPPSLWEAQDEKTLATELGALAVRLNGPRHWLVERASIRLAPGMGQVRTLGSLSMREIAQVQVPITNGVPGLAPYTEVTVLRKNTFSWSKRHRIYELVGPDGSVYVMQAYSQIVDSALTLGALRSLGSRLQLPAGWTYTARKLRHDLPLRTRGEAIVLQDELMNTYQLERRG